MDANRFDTLAKALTGTRSRRSALGTALAGGVLSALGLNQESSARAAQDDRCVLPGAGGTCVLDFEAIVREGPSAGQSLVPGGSPGRLHGYLMFTRGKTGSLDDAKLFLDDGSSLPVTGLAIGQGFQARIDFGRGQALVAVGVGEPDIIRCLGRLDGTVTSTQIGDLGEWHALAGVQNIPVATGSGNRPASTGSGAGIQLAQGDPATGSGSTAGTGNPPLAETSGDQPGSNASGRGNDASGGGSENAPANSGSNPPASIPNQGSSSQGGQGRETVEQRQETGDEPMVLACPEFQTRCGSNCVNLQIDARNCGQCGNACARSEECLNGSCTEGEGACPAGQTRCSNTCVNTTNDVFNCGECGKVCALDEECSGGQCRRVEAEADDQDDDDIDEDPAACGSGQTRCGAICTDLQTDAANCGTCAAACPAGQECAGGKCTARETATGNGCPPGLLLCGNECREGIPNFESEGISCPDGGAPPTACPAGRVLCNGACFPAGKCQPADCSPGWGYCYGVCRDLQNDPGACGKCGTACVGGICLNGTCLICPEGHMPCDGACVNVQGDPEHCGFCNNRCGTQCIDGQCTATGPTPGCTSGTTRCGNACVDLRTDSANCGTCGNVCPTDTFCNPDGLCHPTDKYCQATKGGTFTACGPYCIDLQNDKNACGDCNAFCPADMYCKGGLCYLRGSGTNRGQTATPRDAQSLAPTDQQTLAPSIEARCAPWQEECGGVCTDPSTDPLNCGACGNVCRAGDTCQEGLCTATSVSSDNQTVAPLDAEPPVEPESIPDQSEPPTPICPSGQVECSGVCTDLTLDPLNCGNCDVTCGPGISCDFGVCGAPPAPVGPGDGDLAAPADLPEEQASQPEAMAGEAKSGLEPGIESVQEAETEPAS